MAMGISGLMADKNLRPITDPNPVEVVEDLKSLPDNILAEYAQDRANPNATYALTVLMSRKRAKDALVKEDMPETTVAEDVIADVSGAPQTQQGFGGASMFVPEQQKQQYLAQQLMQQAGPQGTQPIDMQGINTPAPGPEQLMAAGGITRLPTSNIGQNYAGGGIVSFQEGGDVGFPSSYSQLYPSLEFIGTGLGDVASYLNPYSYQKVIDPVTGRVVSRTELEGGRFADTKKVMERELRQARENRQERQREKSIAEIQKEQADFARRGVVDPSLAAYTGDRSMMEAGGMRARDESQGPVVEKPSLAERGEAEEKQRRQIETATDTTTPLIDQIVREGRDTGIDSLRQKYTEEKGIQDYAEDVRKSQEALGLDKDIYADMAAEVKRDRETLAKSKEEAAGLSMIEAGLMIAGGTSPNALTNLKEAAPAVRNFANSVRDLRAEDRSLKTMEFQIASADQAIKQGRADKALAMLEANRNRSFELDKMDLNNEQTAIQKQLDRENNIKLQQLANMRPTDFDRQLAAAKQSGQYNDENGKFNYKEFLSDLRSRTQFDRLIDAAMKSGQYKTPDGQFDFQAFMKDYKPGSTSAGIDEDTIVRAYTNAGGEVVTGMTYQQFKQQFMGGVSSQLSPDDMALINKYSGV